MTENNGLPPAGWQDDPEDATQLRYWDGSVWTDHRAPKPGVEPTYAASVVGKPAEDATAAAQPYAASGATYGDAAPKAGAPWWLAATISAITLLVGIGIGFGIGALVSGDEEPVAAAKTTSAKPSASAEPTDEPTDEPTESAKPKPTNTPTGGGAGTAADPLAIDTPWTFDTSYFGEDATQWEGTFEGLVELPLSEYEEDQNGRCYAVLGTMSPTAIAEGAFTTTGFDTPSLEMIVGGKVAGDYGSCDTEYVDAAGYGSMWNAEVSVGTAYRFYGEIFLPSSATGDVELIVLGSASDPEALFYQPTPTSIG